MSLTAPERARAAKAVDAARNVLPKRHFIIHEWMPSAGNVVYSVGPDGTDDGGKERLPAVRGKPDISPHDIIFMVER